MKFWFELPDWGDSFRPVVLQCHVEGDHAGVEIQQVVRENGDLMSLTSMPEDIRNQIIRRYSEERKTQIYIWED